MKEKKNNKTKQVDITHQTESDLSKITITPGPGSRTTIIDRLHLKDKGGCQEKEAFVSNFYEVKLRS